MSDSNRVSASLVQWVALLFGLAACIFGGLRVPHVVFRTDGALYDFVQEWTSARNWMIEKPVYLDLQESIPLHIPGAKAGELKYNAHPPASILLALPLADVTYQRAFRLWSTFQLACLALALYLITSQKGLKFGWAEKFALTGFLLTGNAFGVQLIQGQFNLLLLLLLAAAWRFERTEKSSLSGVMIGLAGAIKFFPLAMLIFYLAKRRWSAIVAGVLVFAGVNAIALAVFGPEAFTDYVTKVSPAVSRFRDTWPNASLLGFWARLFDGGSGRVDPVFSSPAVSYSLTGVSSLVLAWLIYRTCRRAETQKQVEIAFGVCVLGAVILAPIVWDHYFLLLALPGAILWKHQRARGRMFLLVAVTLLGWLAPVTIQQFVFPGVAEIPGARAATPLQTLTVLALPIYLQLLLIASGAILCGRSTTIDEAIRSSQPPRPEPEN